MSKKPYIVQYWLMDDGSLPHYKCCYHLDQAVNFIQSLNRDRLIEYHIYKEL